MSQMSPADHAIVKAMPGNNECADCPQKHPKWASVSMGALLCLECMPSTRRSTVTFLPRPRFAAPAVRPTRTWKSVDAANQHPYRPCLGNRPECKTSVEFVGVIATLQRASTTLEFMSLIPKQAWSLGLTNWLMA